MRILRLVLASTSLAASPLAAATVDQTLAILPFVPANAAAVDARCTSVLQQASMLRNMLDQTPVSKSPDNFRRFDDLVLLLGGGRSDGALVGQVAPDDARRNAGRACQTKVTNAFDELFASRAVYDRLAAVDSARLDPAGQLVLKRVLAEYDREGVSKDAASRAKVTALRSRINELSTIFQKNIADGRLTITADPAELAGLPADWLAARKPGAEGKVTISTDTPDYVPVMTYASNEALRKRLYMVYMNRAPSNNAVLRELIAKRDELARLLGRPNFATLALEDKMIGTPDKARAFLDDIAVAAETAARRDLGKHVARYQQLSPGATTIPAWSTGYVGQLIRKESYSVDPQEVRQYFAYPKVRDGILQWTRDLFGVDIRR